MYSGSGKEDKTKKKKEKIKKKKKNFRKKTKQKKRYTVEEAQEKRGKKRASKRLDTSCRTAATVGLIKLHELPGRSFVEFVSRWWCCR